MKVLQKKILKFQYKNSPLNHNLISSYHLILPKIWGIQIVYNIVKEERDREGDRNLPITQEG